MPKRRTRSLQAKQRDMHIVFPLGGLNREGSYRQQPPYSSPDLMNVRARGLPEGRKRGGSRPGLVKSHITDIGSNIRMLETLDISMGDNWTNFSDTFAGQSLAAAWTTAAWASNPPSVLPEMLAYVDTTISEGEAVLSALPIDSSSVYVVEIFLAPYLGEWDGKYRLYFRLDDSSPDITTEGVVVELVQTGSTGAYTASLKSYVGGTPSTIDTADDTLGSIQAGWLTATISGTTVTVYWNGVTILTGTVGAHSGLRVGFGMECTEAAGICLANVFRVQYYSTSDVLGTRTMLVASAGGNLYREFQLGTLTQVTTTLTLNDAERLIGTQSGQKLYIADWGDLRVTGTDGTVSGSDLDAASVDDWSALGIDPQDDVVVISSVGGSTTAGTYQISSVAAGAITLTSAPGDGTCSYRIERGPKIYDPVANTLTLWTADSGKGQVPTGCPLIARHLSRVFVAGADIAPHVWYACRRGDENDWDYAQTDSERAVAGTAAAAGVPGVPLTALVPHSDDYLIMACRDQLWRLRGDPAYGGSIDSISHTVGIIGPNAWCVGPEGEVIFLSMNGLYIIPPGAHGSPIPMSNQILPREFRNIDPNTTTVELEYDPNNRGVLIFLSPDSSNERVHWWFDWDSKTFWPMTLQSDHEPLATCALQATAIEESGIVMGCRDGYLRRFSELSGNDCGTAFTSYVMFGPIPLDQDGFVGIVQELVGIMGADSGDVTWAIQTANTFEAAVPATASFTGTWSAGLNDPVYHQGRGQACVLKLSSSAIVPWVYEQVILTVREGGKRRI